MKKAIHIDILAPLAMVGLTILAGAILTLPNTNADDDTAVSTATVTVPVSCTMSGTGMNSHTASIENGRSEENIGTTNIKAYCNDNEGFAIYAVGYTGDTIGNNYLHANNLTQADDILTGTTLSGNTSAWAMKIGVTTGTYTPIIAGSSADTESQSGDTDYSDWALVPNTYQRVAYRNSGTDVDNANIASAEGASLSTTYAAYISPTQKAGTYIGQVKYTLVHPASKHPLRIDCPSGYICYGQNGDTVEGTMGMQEISTSATYATLLASNFSRGGYGFAGWSKTYDYSDSTGFLGPQEYITFTAGQYTDSNPGLSLYAHWVKSAGNLQNWTGCPSLTSGAVTALTDQRDGETYAVAKLADGNCWIIENLRLENTAGHNSDGTLAQGYDTSFAGLANPEAPWGNNNTSANSLYSTNSSTDKTISGSNQSYRFPRYNNINTPTAATDRPNNPTSNYDTNSTSNASMYSYGNYYTWAAAIADTTDYSGGEYNTTSICPKGWRLPAGYIYGEYGIINSGVSGTAASKNLRKYPNNFVLSGFVGGSVSNRGSNGYYWSSTSRDNSYVYHLSFTSGDAYPGTISSIKDMGQSIRCLISGT